MAISEDRLSISEITKGEVSDFQKTVDSSINSITGTINGISSEVEGTINSAIAGFEKKTSDLLDPIKKIDIPFSSQSSGILDNLLCLKIPDIDFRLPSFKLDIFKDWNIDFNMKICGESKKINPVDAALSVVDKVKNPSSFLNETKKDLINRLLGDNLSNKLGVFGVSNLTDCVLGDSLSGVKDYNDIFGGSLSYKMDLNDLLGLDGCAGDFIRDQSRNNGLSNITTESILAKMAFTRNTETSDQVMSGMRNSDPESTSRATSRMMSSSEEIPAIYTKTDMIPKSYYTGLSDEYMQKKVDEILNNTPTMVATEGRAVLLSPLDVDTKEEERENITIQEKINLQTDSSNMFKSIANEDIYKKDKIETFNNIILTADLIDKNWNKDEYGNVNMYKIKNNKNMVTLTEEYIKNKPVEIDDNLTGDFTTNINAAEMILANNLEFKENVLV